MKECEFDELITDMKWMKCAILWRLFSSTFAIIVADKTFDPFSKRFQPSDSHCAHAIGFNIVDLLRT